MNPLLLLAMGIVAVGMILRLFFLGLAALARLLWEVCQRMVLAMIPRFHHRRTSTAAPTPAAVGTPLPPAVVR
jgi:hypothetical protein